MEVGVQDYQTTEQPPLTTGEGEKLLKTILGEANGKLFGEGVTLTDLVISDYGEKGGGPGAVLEGTLSDGKSFIINADLNGDERTPRTIFVEDPNGSAQTIDIDRGMVRPHLISVDNPPAPGALKQQFRESLAFGKPAMIRESFSKISLLMI